jgi:hypothetical protein
LFTVYFIGCIGLCWVKNDSSNKSTNCMHLILLLTHHMWWWKNTCFSF